MAISGLPRTGFDRIATGVLVSRNTATKIPTAWPASVEHRVSPEDTLMVGKTGAPLFYHPNLDAGVLITFKISAYCGVFMRIFVLSPEVSPKDKTILL